MFLCIILLILVIIYQFVSHTIVQAKLRAELSLKEGLLKSALNPVKGDIIHHSSGMFVFQGEKWVSIPMIPDDSEIYKV